MIDATAIPIATWQGELLWPTPLPSATVIDARGVAALGCWVHDWLRARPGTVLVAAPELGQRLLRAALPVRWYATLDEALAAGGAGVSASERATLWA
jgi:hypothetical protein